MGFLTAFFLNLLFRAGWLAAALVCLALHRLVGAPLVLVWVMLGAWALHALIVTILAGAAVKLARWADRSSRVNPNRNPYSKK